MAEWAICRNIRKFSYKTCKNEPSIEFSRPISTVDGAFRAGDTSFKQVRLDWLSNKKAEKLFNTIDSNNDGKLTENEICDYRKLYINEELRKRETVWSKILCFFCASYKVEIEAEREFLLHELKLTNDYRNINADTV